MLWLIAQATKSRLDDYPRWVQDIIADKTISFVVFGTILLVLIVVAIWGVMWIRGMTGEAPSSSLDHLTEFEDLYDRGAFSEDEMSKLKEVIRDSMEDEVPTNLEEPKSNPLKIKPK